MTSQISIKLIDGIFSPADAKKIIVDMINYKIAHHEMAKLQSYEKTCTTCEDSVNRIAALKAERKAIKAYFADLDPAITEIEIDGPVNVINQVSASKAPAETAS